MRNILLVVLLSSSAYAKKPATPAVAVAPSKPTHIERAEMFEGRLLDRDAAAFQTRVVDYQARLKAQYGVDIAAGDKVDLETGTITWHMNAQPTK